MIKGNFTLLCLIIIGSFLKAQIPTNGLVAYYPFNGNANDESGNGNNGIVNGATLTTDRCGNLNSAYYFDGRSNIIVSPSSFYLRNYSYSCWFKLTLLPTLGIGFYIISIGGTGGDQVIALVNEYSGLGIGFQCGGYSSPTVTVQAATEYLPTTINKWYHIVSVRSNDSVKLYINAVLVGQNTTNTMLPYYSTNNTSFTIGSRFNNSQYTTGAIDEVRIYNRVLDSTEIAKLYYTNCNSQNSAVINGNKVVCQGQTGVGYNVLGMDSITNYIWSYSGTGATINGSSDTILIEFANNATSGIIKVIGNRIGGKVIDTATLSITVNPLPSEAGVITGDNKVCLNQNGLSYHVLPVDNATSYIWNYSGNGATINGNSNNIQINFGPNATSGNLTVSGNNLCGTGSPSPLFSIEVDSCNQGYSEHLNIPNSFSPNGDGINDFFVIRGLIENSKLIIFNRFGKKLYESDNYKNNWNGTDNNGKNLPTDTYWYVLILPGFPSEFKGFVYLKK